ncbi:MAG TPA: cytochrome P450 [Ktedonobacteraceae bacterium]|nr:cytochrome P450 [Ktedonobacteraceae bacterium]
MDSITIMERQLNPFPWYRQMRETNPVSYSEEYGGWSVFRYNDVLKVLTDYSIFSSQYMGEQEPLAMSLLNTDPPRHRQLRSLVTQAFTPRRIAQLEPRITQIVNELLDKVQSTGKMDVVDDLAYPLPVIVIAEMLGIPPEEREQFKHWSDELVGETRTPGHNPQLEMGKYFYQMIEQRRQEPRNDLISALIEAQIDDEHLNLMELLGFCILLLVAGNETTTTLLGNALLALTDHPEAMEELRAQPELLPDAIEEVLRYLSPVKSMYRMALKDTELGGKQVKEGDFITAWIGSADRDEEQFPEADRFDMHRSPNRHLAFGHGIHFCLGAPLARLEAKVALGLMLERLPNIQRVRDIPLQPSSSYILQGVKHLPITFEK